MKLYQDRKWLYQKYWIEKLSTIQIAKLCNSGKSTISKWLKIFDIHCRLGSACHKKGIIPWNKGLKAKDDVRIKKFVEAGHKACIGRIPWNKGLPSYLQSMYGKHHSEEIRKKISNSNKGKKASPEMLKKLSESHKGQIAWSKGLTKETDSRLAKINKARKGQIPWIKGLTKETDERVNKISQSNMGRIVTKKTRGKISISNKGQIPWIKGLTKETDERVKRYSEKLKERMQNPDFQKRFQKAMHAKPNNLEQYFNQITLNCIQYVGDYRFWIKTKKHSHNPDFRITGQKKIIEIFGDYWHKGENPEELIEEYAKVDWKCLVFWESEVYEKPERILEETLEFIKTKPKQLSLI